MTESYLNGTFDKARSLLDRPAVVRRASQTDAIRHDSFDARVFAELMDEAPALAELAREDLGQKYHYTEDLTRDVLMEFWQGDPVLREAREMEPSRLLNHAVAFDIGQSPETPQTRTFTKHDRYGAAMATIAVTEKIKESLEKAREKMEADQAAEEARKEFEQAMKDLAQKLKDLGIEPPPGGPAGDDEDEGGCQLGGVSFGGVGEPTDEPGTGSGVPVSGPLGGAEGPLTPEQQDALDALEAAIEEVEAKGLSYEETLDAAVEESEQAQRALRATVNAAVKDAGNALAEEADLMSAWGLEDGQLKLMSFQERQMLASALRRNRLNAFRKLIGRFRTMAAAQRAKKVEYARDEAYDVELSDRLPDVLASEMALLVNEHTRLDFLERLAEGQLLSKKYRGIEKIAQGSIIALVDNSGSMTASVGGFSREAYAKAFALALLDQARAAGRDFVGINFSSENQVSVFRFPKGQGDITEVLRFIEEFWGGGTDYMQPLDMAMDILDKEFNDAGLIRADLVMITDDDCRVTDAWFSRYEARKEKLGFRTFGIAVGTHAGNALGKLSDNVRSIHEFSDPMAVADIMRTV